MTAKLLDGTTASEVLHRFETLRLVGLDRLLGDERVLVIAPHPDDESLGCGGLIAACCAAGRPPAVVILTDGTGSHPHSRQFPPARLRAVREHEARAATALLGLPVECLHFLGLRDTMAPHDGPAFDAAVARIVALARAHRCSVVAAPWIHDPHGDHVAAQKMARGGRDAAGLRLLSYPVWGWTIAPDTVLPSTAITGWRLDIAPHMAAKRQAIAAHESQYGELIHDDPTGFRLPPALLRMFERPFEVFLADA